MRKIFLTYFLVLVVFGGCKPSRHDLCNKDFPKALAEFEGSIVALAPWSNADKGRALASNSASSPGLPEQDKISWMSWSRKKLALVQQLSDYTRGNPHLDHLKVPLNDVANELVYFHSYAEQGDVNKMIHSLKFIYEEGSKAQEIFCSGS